MDAGLRATLQDASRRAATLAEAAAAEGGDALARRAASALYHLTTAVAMAWEAQRIGKPERLQLCRLVLQHRLLPVDPLAADTGSQDDAEQLLRTA
jgi:hypothetical protein